MGCIELTRGVRLIAVWNSLLWVSIIYAHLSWVLVGEIAEAYVVKNQIVMGALHMYFLLRCVAIWTAFCKNDEI